MLAVVGLVVAYLAGSIPAAYLAGRARGIDLRQHGSGNLGTTNVFRVLGWPLGVAVFFVDAAKGALPVALLPDALGLLPAQPWAIAFGVAAIVGHVKPIFLLGRGGGKGVATASGVFFALAPTALTAVTVLFAAIVIVTGIVSLGSLAAAAALPVGVFLTQGLSPVFWLSLAIGAFVFLTHRANLRRLLRGEEPSFRKRRAAAPPATVASPGAGAPPGGER